MRSFRHHSTLCSPASRDTSLPRGGRMPRSLLAAVVAAVAAMIPAAAWAQAGTE
jgi:hypothetical protein